ncbi:hypothetical protein D9M71_249430 [compost metagenome]
MQVAQQLTFGSGTPLLAQLLRTQPQEGKRDIEQLYLQAVNNATQSIYIENQYFRWPPLAEAIKKAAADQTGEGRDPGLHGSLHLFVITNATSDSVGAGSVNTQRMLESLGRANTIPEVTKLRRIQQVKKDAPPKPYPDLRDPVGRRELAFWQADLNHGSANINTRSMQVDTELNIAHEWASVTRDLRRRLWGLHTAGFGVQDGPGKAYKAWQEIIDDNKRLQNARDVPCAPIIEFFYDKATLKDLD